MREHAANKGGNRNYNPTPVPPDPTEREPGDTWAFRAREMRGQRDHALHAKRLRAHEYWTGGPLAAEMRALFPGEELFDPEIRRLLQVAYPRKARNQRLSTPPAKAA